MAPAAGRDSTIQPLAWALEYCIHKSLGDDEHVDSIAGLVEAYTPWLNQLGESHQVVAALLPGICLVSLRDYVNDQDLNDPEALRHIVALVDSLREACEKAGGGGEATPQDKEWDTLQTAVRTQACLAWLRTDESSLDPYTSLVDELSADHPALPKSKLLAVVPKGKDKQSKARADRAKTALLTNNPFGDFIKSLHNFIGACTASLLAKEPFLQRVLAAVEGGTYAVGASAPAGQGAAPAAPPSGSKGKRKRAGGAEGVASPGAGAGTGAAAGGATPAKKIAPSPVQAPNMTIPEEQALSLKTTEELEAMATAGGGSKKDIKARLVELKRLSIAEKKALKEKLRLPKAGSDERVRVGAYEKAPTVEGPGGTTIKQIRERNKWTPEETQAIVDGVAEYGKHWAMILNKGALVFAKGRTQIDLKDKWRNLVKSGKVDGNAVGPRRPVPVLPAAKAAAAKAAGAGATAGGQAGNEGVDEC